jgi:parvulin-like peptidyl-prolyl isomerase
MTKKRVDPTEESDRQSRKEVLLARRSARQNRQIRLAIAIVLSLLFVLVVVALVAEYGIKPGQPVAVVNGETITTRDWQDRVRFQRAQFILGIEDLAETFGGDVGLVQQYVGQQMQLLQDPVTLGQLVLDDMIDEVLIRQGAEQRGITVTDQDVQDALEESFSFFDGELPTPLPTPTETVQPTPSLTPIPTEVITEVIPTNTPFPTPTLGPTGTPLPTATPISQEAFQESFNETMSRFSELGVDEQTYRDVLRAQLYEEKLMEALAEEQEMAEEEEQVSLYYLLFQDEEQAQTTVEELEESDFLTVWNTIRSQPFDAESETPAANAGEVLWRTRSSLETTLSETVTDAAFDLPVGEPSELLVDEAETEEETDRYFIIQVSGREVRPLTESAITSAQQQALADWVEGQRTQVETFDRWRARVPTSPRLDPSFFAAPTEAPAVTEPSFEIPTTEPEPTTAATPDSADEDEGEAEPTDDGT